MNIKQEWKLTDCSSMQHIQALTDRIFNCIEMGLLNPETEEYAVSRAYIDLDDCADDEILNIIRAYGYQSVAEMQEVYNAETNTVVAECIFESTCTTIEYAIFKGTESECEAYIKEYIKGE